MQALFHACSLQGLLQHAVHASCGCRDLDSGKIMGGKRKYGELPACIPQRARYRIAAFGTKLDVHEQTMGNVFCQRIAQGRAILENPRIMPAGGQFAFQKARVHGIIFQRPNG